MFRRSIACLIGIFCSLPFLQSCEPTCDVPVQPGLSSVRIVTNFAGVDTLRVVIDSALFEQAYFNVSDPNLYPQTRTGRLGYHSDFRGSGAFLREGVHHVLAYSGSSAIPLVDTLLTFTKYRQTLVFMGKEGSSTHPPKVLYLDDATRARDETRSLFRFVHTVTDLDTIDVYFSKYVKLGTNGKPKPDLRIAYGEISSEDGTGHGTGRLATDYYAVPVRDTGLLITAANDTNEVIFSLPYALGTNGFLATVIVRGETKPVGTEQVASSAVFADGLESEGTVIYSTSTFGVRLSNLTREPFMSLVIKGNNDQAPRDNIALQDYVKYIHRDSTGRFFPLTMTYHKIAKYFLSPVDSGRWAADSNAMILPERLTFLAEVNRRYTFIAIDSALTGSGDRRLGIVPLTDSMTLAGPGKTRVRFFNSSPDHVANFTFGGTTFSLRQGQVGYADAPLGPQQVAVTDGTTSGTLRFTLDSELPMTVYILPPQGGDPYPTSVAHN